MTSRITFPGLWHISQNLDTADVVIKGRSSLLGADVRGFLRKKDQGLLFSPQDDFLSEHVLLVTLHAKEWGEHSFFICEYFLFANWSTLLVDVTGWPRCISKKPSPSLTLCWATFAEYWRCESREFTSTLTLACQAAWWPSHSWKVVQEFRKVPHWSYISPVCWHIFFITSLMNGTSLHLNSKFSLFSLMCFA